MFSIRSSLRFCFKEFLQKNIRIFDTILIFILNMITGSIFDFQVIYDYGAFNVK